jgi:hypothetical protein
MHRPDLLERTMAFDLDVPTKRKTEAEVEEKIGRLTPQILGGLLDLAVKVLDTEIANPPPLPRMADFVLLLHKLDAVLGPVDAGDMTAVEAYTEELEELFEDSLTGDPVATEVIRMMKGRTTWTGTTEQLLKELEKTKREHDQYWSPSGARQSGQWWPKTATELGNALTRAKPLLRDSGVEMSKDRATIDGTQKRVTKLVKSDPDSGTAGTAISHTCTSREEGEEEETRAGVHIEEFGVPAVQPTGVTAITCPSCVSRPMKQDLISGRFRCLSVQCGYEETAE